MPRKPKTTQLETRSSAPSRLVVSLLLAASTLAVFWRVGSSGFIHYDDGDYVKENAHVREGFRLEGVVWAFTTSHSANWHPLTWLSHMLDCQLFGRNAGGHHWTSLLLHVLNTILLFWVLDRTSRARWPSALVAALFALHPLHVESVAWIAERKDVLSGLFWMLTLAAYSRYVERLERGWYAAALALFALGLMAKPMLVTLPFVLLLLDYWPLGRIEDLRALGRRAVEKIPFFALSVASGVVTFVVQRKWGAVASATELSWAERLAGAMLAYAAYLRKMLWPSDLAVFYPLRADSPVWLVVAAAAALAAATALVLRQIRRRPYLATGWFWYLGTLVPVIGLVQVGDQAMADRYTYLPLVGIFVMVGWGGAELLRNRRAAAFVAAAALAACSVAAWFQVGYWKSSIKLFEHALRVTENNYLAHACLGIALAEAGRNEAIPHYREALRVNPYYSQAEASLGLALAQSGSIGEAIDHYREALRLRPSRIEVMNNLAWLRATARDPRFRNSSEAVELAERACRMTDYSNPNYLDTLAAAYAEAGQTPKAVQIGEKAVQLALSTRQPDLARTIEERTKLYRAGHAYRE